MDLQGWRALGLRCFVVTTSLIAATFAPKIHANESENADAVREVSVRMRPLQNASAGISVSGDGIKVLSVDGSDSEARRQILRTMNFAHLTLRYLGGVWAVLDAGGKRLATAVGRKIEIQGDGLRIDLRPAPSHVQLVARTQKAEINPRVELVGFLTIENYLEGVLAGEIPRDWPIEAMKAQAVAARSFAIAKIRDRLALKPDWLLESNVLDQVFDFERGHARAFEAVRATTGEVLITDAVRGAFGVRSHFEDSRVVAANYHSDCGGRTDEPRAIWGGGVKTGTATDSICASSHRSAWRYLTTLDRLSKILTARRLVPQGFELTKLAVFKKSEGGRALDLIASAADGRQAIFPGERLREALGYSELKSTLFDMKSKSVSGANQIEFSGRGFGHGAGLCQWGARQLALAGRSYREILRHYYPELRLEDRRQRMALSRPILALPLAGTDVSP